VIINFRRVVHTLVCLFGFLAALCLANRPRYWWQELFCSFALYWYPFALVALVWLLRAICRRGGERSWISAAALCCYAYISVYVIVITAPYFFYNKWQIARSDGGEALSGLWIECGSNRDTSSEIERLIERRDPTIVLISGVSSLELLEIDSLSRFVHRTRSASDEKGGLRLFSRLPFGLHITDNLGIEAFPGGVFVLEPQGMIPIEVGVMTLDRSTSQSIFERNRVTARRLASLMRNSHAPRVVVAQFGTTPFSQLMNLYAEQTRMRSLMFGIGLHKTFDMENPLVAVTDSNVFVSRDLTREVFERIHLPQCKRAALFFRIQYAKLTEIPLDTASNTVQ
jgi:hypothetical protein